MHLKALKSFIHNYGPEAEDSFISMLSDFDEMKRLGIPPQYLVLLIIGMAAWVDAESGLDSDPVLVSDHYSQVVETMRSLFSAQKEVH